jgi:hypothetical protein
MIFRSKVDAWIGAILLLATGAQIWAALFIFTSGHPGRWVAVPLLLIGPVLILWIMATTYYVVSSAELLIRCGPVRVRIPIDQIANIQKTRNPLSSPALSLDRLAINYGKGQTCMISPKDQAGFLETLRAHGVRAA